ncbi:3-hydroxyacyl-CoA dehydrogenase family protein [Streptomyces sp. NBC_01506]|uniref:3-hydroxyacyl-CoA dehydrogenase family protein n=1 Tax=Streptomyces sp. NBC_01506 TaxID=2903887 RepID=UPI003868374B
MSTDPLVIIGAGVMGTGIAALALGHGMPVVLLDVSPAILDQARRRVRRSLRHGRLMGSFPADRPDGALTTVETLGADLRPVAVIEAVTEDASTKVKTLTQLSEFLPPGVPLITNTSSIPLSELAASLGRPAELVGVHFMNPAYLVEMTELVRGSLTDEATVTAATALLRSWGRRVVVVHDAPGFVTSRLLHPMINEAVRLVGAGTAGVEEVDALMEGCLGHRTGPLGTADLIGLDNLADSLRELAQRTENPSYQPCDLLLSKVAQGHLGRKSGRGFYEYGDVLS